MALKKFPQEIKHLTWNSKFKQKWNTQVQTSGSGMVRTLTNQLYPQWTITETFGLLDDDTADKLMAFVASVKGGYEPFLWLDHTLNRETGRALPVIVPGKYQAVWSIDGYVEPAEYIEDVTVYVDGKKQTSGYSVSDGVISFSTAPATGAVVTADYTYWFKVRFSDDGGELTRVFENVNNSSSFKMDVVR